MCERQGVFAHQAETRVQSAVTIVVQGPKLDHAKVGEVDLVHQFVGIEHALAPMRLGGHHRTENAIK